MSGQKRPGVVCSALGCSRTGRVAPAAPSSSPVLPGHAESLTHEHERRRPLPDFCFSFAVFSSRCLSAVSPSRSNVAQASWSSLFGPILSIMVALAALRHTVAENPASPSVSSPHSPTEDCSSPKCRHYPSLESLQEQGICSKPTRLDQLSNIGLCPRLYQIGMA